jgi:hypothetical protein
LFRCLIARLCRCNSPASTHQATAWLWAAQAAIESHRPHRVYADKAVKITKVAYMTPWQVLGPFAIGKGELDGDPACAQIAANRQANCLAQLDPYHTNVTFFSEVRVRYRTCHGFWHLSSCVKLMCTSSRVEYGCLRPIGAIQLNQFVPGGKVTWRPVSATATGVAVDDFARSAQSRANSVAINFPAVDWNVLVQALSSTLILEVQATLYSELMVPQAGQYVVHCDGVHSILIDRHRWVVGDQYVSGTLWSALPLAAGVHTVHLRVRGKTQANVACQFSRLHASHPVDSSTSFAATVDARGAMITAVPALTAASWSTAHRPLTHTQTALFAWSTPLVPDAMLESHTLSAPWFGVRVFNANAHRITDLGVQLLQQPDHCEFGSDDSASGLDPCFRLIPRHVLTFGLSLNASVQSVVLVFLTIRILLSRDLDVRW